MDPSELSIQETLGLFTEINGDLREAPYDVNLIAPQLAWMRTGKQGLKTRFPLQLVSNGYKKRRPGDPTPHRRVEIVEFTCEVAELDPDANFIPQIDLDSDIHGVIEPELPGIVSRARLAPDQELAVTILSNPVTSYDKIQFWQTVPNHPYNPLRPGLGKFANWYLGVPIGRAGITKALDFFVQMRGFDGKIQRKPGKYIGVTTSKDQASRFKKFVQEGIIASDAGTASESTTLRGEIDDVLVYPELGDSSIGGNPKDWYVARVASDKDRPFVVNYPQTPQTYIDGLNPNDVTRVIHRGVRYGWRSVLGCSFLWPQNIVRFRE